VGCRDTGMVTVGQISTCAANQNLVVTILTELFCFPLTVIAVTFSRY
jgi:hypothetical protein